MKKPDLKDFTITFTCICVQQKTWSTAWNESSVTMHAGKCPCTSGFFVECSTLSKMSKNYKNTTAGKKNYSVHCVSIVFPTLFSPTFLKILRKIRWLAIFAVPLLRSRLQMMTLKTWKKGKTIAAVRSLLLISLLHSYHVLWLISIHAHIDRMYVFF